MENGSSCLCGERLHAAGQQATSPHHKKQSLSSLVQVSFYSSSSKVSRSLHGMRRKLSSNPSLGHDRLALRRISVVAVDLWLRNKSRFTPLYCSYSSSLQKLGKQFSQNNNNRGRGEKDRPPPPPPLPPAAAAASARPRCAATRQHLSPLPAAAAACRPPVVRRHAAVVRMNCRRRCRRPPPPLSSQSPDHQE
jgi:hypothetical protein